VKEHLGVGLVLCSRPCWNSCCRASCPRRGQLQRELPSPFPSDEQKSRTKKLRLLTGVVVAKGRKNVFQSYYLKNDEVFACP